MSIFGFASTKRLAAVIILGSFVFSNVIAGTVIGSDHGSTGSKSSATTKYTTDLTQLGREGRLRENLNFENETTRLIKVLAEGGVRQPVIVDEDKATIETIVEQLAIRTANGKVPANLAGKSVIKIDTPLLFSNARTAAAIAQIVDSIVNDAIASKGKTILYIDELTSLVGASASTTNLFKAVEAGKIVIIGGSSSAAYENEINSQPEIAGYFSGILITDNASAAVKPDANRNNDDEGYRGDNISPDLREMMANDPSGNTRVDVIMQAKDADNLALRSLIANGQAHITDRIGSTDTLVVNLPLSVLEPLSTSGLINYISPDRPMASMGHIEDTTGATQMRTTATGGCISTLTRCDGSGVGIAIVDSGIYAAHNGFKDGSGVSRVVASVNFSSSNNLNDNYGHGTHVAGLAAGNSSVSSYAYRGIAPDADIISVKVLNDYGKGTTSSVLNGLNWILTNHDAYNIRVVNLSLGTTAVDTWTNDPVCLKVKDLVSAGITVFAAAGNDGKDSNGNKIYGGIHSPGISPYAITVGASNSMGTVSHADDVITTYSSLGPTRSYFTTSTGTKVYDNLIKPDLVAPGNKLISYKSPNNYLVSIAPLLALDLTNGPDSDMYLSGTSMSTPLASGTAALLLEINPNLTPGMIRMLLQYTADPVNGANTFEQGAGELNIDGAMRLARTLRTDVDFQTLSKGNSTVTSPFSMPATNSTIGGNNFPWSQLITGKYTFLTGQNLVSQFQVVYKDANFVGQGVNFSNGNYSLNTTTYFTSGLSLNRNIILSNGTALGGGSIFLSYGVTSGDGAPAGDGVLVGDSALMRGGVLVGDGVMVGDGVICRGGVLVGDAVLNGDLVIKGDNTAHM
jgi:subtilisin family serine protease